MNEHKDENFRTVRGYQMKSRKEGHLTPAQEDYLEMAYRLFCRQGYVRVGQLSELLHVKPSSASKMILKLSQLSYLDYDRYEIIMLTEKGKEMGAYLIFRHETAERFLHYIGCLNPLEEAELIEHYLSRETVCNLNDLLDFLKANDQLKDNLKSFKLNRKNPL
ncbi:MAG: DtxR family transcriptional regulator [Clostridiales bacterium]|jgi:Mn-dependent DtxR family transcriptional regulator|nr:DtxR family transcriptional regulator [Clostridiales bacterium]